MSISAFPCVSSALRRTGLFGSAADEAPSCCRTLESVSLPKWLHKMNYPNWKDHLPNRSSVAECVADDSALYDAARSVLAEDPIDVGAARRLRPLLLAGVARARNAMLNRTAKDLSKLLRRLDRAIDHQPQSFEDLLPQNAGRKSDILALRAVNGR
jgi:hypothetical protein